METKRATNKERQEMKEAILGVISHDAWHALDVGQVLVSMGSAMMKGCQVTEADFLDYARKAWAAQQRQPVEGN